MIDIKIPQDHWLQWQASVELIANLMNCTIVLSVIDGEGQLCEKIAAEVKAKDVTSDVVSNVQNGRSETSFSIEVLWPSKAVFGELSVNFTVQADNLPEVPEQARKLAQLAADNIELHLANIYRGYRQQESEARGAIDEERNIELQLFIDSLKEHVWMKDVDGRYVIFNRSVEKSWGKTREEIINKTDEELFVSDLAKEFIQADIEAINKGEQITVGECKGQHAEIDRYWLETSKVPVVTDDGSLKGVIGLSRNISQHKAIQEQLELSGRVFENSVEGVMITDRDGKILETYGAFSEITGYTREEVLGKNPSMFSSGRHDKAFYGDMWTGLLHKGRWHGEIWNRRKNGAIFPQLLTLSSMLGDDGLVRYFVAVFADISAQKKSEAELAHLAYHDPLTKLPNRMTLTAQIEQEIRHAQHQGSQLAIVFIDVDLFKHINDSFGHLMGDEILVELAARLTMQKSTEDTLARIGGDEFVVLFPEGGGSEELTLAVSKLRAAFDQPFSVGDNEQIRLTASMGVSVYPHDGKDCYTLLRNADAAKHRAKQDGRNSYAFYTESLTLESREHLKLQSALHVALEEGNFHLVYQPKLNFNSLKTVGFEALLRWEDPVLGVISPGIFIPIAEKIGLINSIGSWVLREACQQGVKWIGQGKTFGRIAVNVAGQQIKRSSFVDEVKQILSETGFPAQSLELEVTESFMMSDPEAAARDLRVLGDLGIELSVDDFGTGYSSLNYLKKLPIHKLKIDQSFVRDIPVDANNTAIAKAVIALGHALNLQVVAEGVETELQADFLRESGCDEVQGYLYSRPQLPEDLQKFLL
ncbi:sensor domain-containing protein [Shewanella atlantica]|uniref:cyclic-guanylate-specific phosphodiesterase n=1 Tax=Shewanella atlantica TaxID=271099 RepID=A0A3S0LGM4_9GAMM|nr:bifunctional diguanylate cyclase/phosphodiesterase [Shewanella atlantica]RTR34986.1 bifunctional diguanylate cyclase/phosphodiesterase [Shewanella atlantica]